MSVAEDHLFFAPSMHWIKYWQAWTKHFMQTRHTKEYFNNEMNIELFSYIIRTKQISLYNSFSCFMY